MFASKFTPHYRLWRAAFPLLAAIALVQATQVHAAPICKPSLAFKDVRFSEMNLETMQRKWTAVLSVDASRCATTSGRFEILFSQLKETALDSDFVEPFVWKPDRVEVSVDFAADESVQQYRLDRIDACPCRE